MALKLSTCIFIKHDRIDYSYDVEDNTHSAWFSRNGKSVRRLTAEEMAGCLEAYRGEGHYVGELITWLTRFF